MLRGRVISTTYEYDDPDHPNRVTRSFASPAWSPDDHDLMLALAEHEASLCPGCGHPKDWAWRDDDESAGWFDKHEITCHACAVLHGPERATYSLAEDTWPTGKPHPPVRPQQAEPAPPPHPIPE